MQLVKPIVGQDYDAGYIGFCKTRATGIVAAFSNLITWFETQEEDDKFQQALGEDSKDAPSHVITVISKTECIEAYIGGVQISPLSKYLGDPKVEMVFRKPVDMSPVDSDLIIAGARSILGKPYNYLGLFGRAFLIATRLDKIAWYNKQPLLINLFHESYYCSAAASHALKNDKKYEVYPLFQKFNESKITPALLYGNGPFKPLTFGLRK